MKPLPSPDFKKIPTSPEEEDAIIVAMRKTVENFRAVRRPEKKS